MLSFYEMAYVESRIYQTLAHIAAWQICTLPIMCTEMFQATDNILLVCMLPGENRMMPITIERPKCSKQCTAIALQIL